MAILSNANTRHNQVQPDLSDIFLGKVKFAKIESHTYYKNSFKREKKTRPEKRITLSKILISSLNQSDKKKHLYKLCEISATLNHVINGRDSSQHGSKETKQRICHFQNFSA